MCDHHTADHHTLSGMPFCFVFRDHASYVANVLRRLGVAEEDRDDLLQDVFMTVHALRGVYDAARPLRPWLCGIAHRLVLRHRRLKRRLPEPRADFELTAAGSTPFEALDAKQQRALVHLALERVDFERRVVFMRKDIEGQPMPEVADGLGIGVNTGYSRLRVARAEFSAELRRLTLASAG